MHDFLAHPLVRQLFSLNLPTEHFAIAGSGPLFVRGWIDDPGDLDLVARGPAWEIAAELGGPPRSAPYGDVQRIPLFDGHLEVLDGWFPERWSTDHLIDDADKLAGLRFVTLDVVGAVKRALDRPRDRAHLKIMLAHGFQP